MSNYQDVDLIEIAEARVRKTLSEQFFDDKAKMARKLKQIFKQYDVDGSGELSYDEFECAMIKDLNMVGMRKEVRLLFDKYDNDCSNQLSIYHNIDIYIYTQKTPVFQKYYEL